MARTGIVSITMPVRRRVSIDLSGISRVKQEFAEETNINVIMRKYVVTGELSHLAARPGYYEDLSSIGDFTDAQLSVVRAKAIFSELPVEVRESFRNDPALFFKFVGDSANDSAVKELFGGKPAADIDAVVDVVDKAKEPEVPPASKQVVIPDPEAAKPSV